MSSSLEQSRHDEWERLILSYLEGSLPDVDVPKVTALMTEVDFQRLLADHAIEHALLYETFGHASLVVQLHGRDSLAVPDRSPRPTVGRTWLSLAAALMIAASGALLAYIVAAGHDPSRSVSVVQVIGNVTADDISVDAGTQLEERTVIRTQGLTSFARLGFEDGTELRLSGDAAVACRQNDGQKFVDILSGQVSASVARQPSGHPLVIKTQSASMEVLGTDLAVSAEDDATRLNVATGSVKMRRQADGEEITVERGQFAVAAQGSSLSVNRLRPAPSDWEVGFSRGLPAKWQRGEYVRPSAAAPEGAIRAEFAQDDGYWTIIAPNEWSDGYFRVEEDSFLNFRIRMDRPDWYQVILCVRDDMFGAPHGHPYHEFQESTDLKKITPGEWRTVSVPFSAFRLTQREEDVPYFDRSPIAPPAGSTVFLFLFSTQTEDRGLEIEKIWVTRGRPSEEWTPSDLAPITAAGSPGAHAESRKAL